MPELPEVENAASYLRKALIGSSISFVSVTWPRIIREPGLGSLTNNLPGHRIECISRRGKFIVMDFTNGDSSSETFSILLHLGMSGSLEIAQSHTPRQKHHHVVFGLSDHRELRFHDPRKFGRIYFTTNPSSILSSLGREPLDQGLSSKEFYTLLQKRKGAIKPLLLNQRFLAGVGNIYADEGLWSSKLHPLKPANKIAKDKTAQLLLSLRRILKAAIKAKGTDFGDGVVSGGRYRPRVYGRDGKFCARCKTKIKRIVISQRGTHFCPCCQKI